MKEADLDLSNLQALDVTYLTLAKNVVFSIINKKAIINLMKVLINMYKKSFVSNKVFLISYLFNLKMNEGMFVANHINNFNEITNQLNFVEVTFDNKIKALILLSFLPKSQAIIGTIVSNFFKKRR